MSSTGLAIFGKSASSLRKDAAFLQWNDLGHQVGGLIFPETPSDAEKTREPFAAGGLDNPAAQFREFTAECLELAQRTRSPEKRLAVVAETTRAFFWNSTSCGGVPTWAAQRNAVPSKRSSSPNLASQIRVALAVWF